MWVFSTIYRICIELTLQLNIVYMCVFFLHLSGLTILVCIILLGVCVVCVKRRRKSKDSVNISSNGECGCGWVGVWVEE